VDEAMAYSMRSMRRLKQPQADMQAFVEGRQLERNGGDGFLRSAEGAGGRSRRLGAG